MLLSCDLASLDAFTLNLITNDEVLALNQDALVVAAHQVAHVTGSWQVWQKPLADGSTAVGLFNLADTAQVISVSDEQLGLTGPRVVRDLWRQKDIGALGGVFSAKVEPHGVVLVGIRQK
jgi:alpha-galactosidase